MNPSPLSAEDYHKLSDRAMDNILESLEEAIDAGVGRNAEEGWESGVLTLSCGPHGTYVLNKQPPNQQIWLSSPLSGPKRYDYSLGVWFYTRDGSTLKQLMEAELAELAGESVGVWVERR
ncbi:Frataxin [Dacryopinax primogenitus]|uniref:ferroxidase n=1 Tax=Dacryopinax primogenitus (strain DJM 731) TaxID=1858805 RepID=M5FSL5_DACPD|nr:Frataxin [Dacryopinax primogenitus]EJT98908.1 Frataxin [Dacryopinax primogenitus]